jgi:hypothetical protein
MVKFVLVVQYLVPFPVCPFFPLYAIDGGSQINSMSVIIPIGLNLARMFGDKFLKEQDMRFSSEPYVSQAVRITRACTAFAVIAR